MPAGTENSVAAVILAGCGGLLLGYDNGANSRPLQHLPLLRVQAHMSESCFITQP